MYFSTAEGRDNCKIAEKTCCVFCQLTPSGERGQYGVVAVLRVAVVTNPARENATRHHRPMEVATAMVLTVTSEPVTLNFALRPQVRTKYNKIMISFIVYM